jgi:hypothetical protein
VQNWNTLMKAFMKEYYSPGKTQSLRNKIATFAQYPTETISEAFEHFNEYTQEVPLKDRYGEPERGGVNGSR